MTCSSARLPNMSLNFYASEARSKSSQQRLPGFGSWALGDLGFGDLGHLGSGRSGTRP